MPPLDEGRLRQALTRTARHLAGDADEAEDLVQEVLLVLADRGAAIRDRQATLAWCQAVLRNAFRQRQRRAWYGRLNPSGLAGAPEGQASPWEQVDDRLEIERSLEALAPHHRVAAREFYLNGCSVAELADRLGRPAGTIKRWLHESREAMRVSLTDQTTKRAYLYGKRWPPAGKRAVVAALVEAGYQVVAAHAGPGEAWPTDAALFVLAEGTGTAPGLELLLNLKADAALQSVPTILFGPERHSAIVAAWQAGADIYLTRVDRAELVGLLRQLAGQRGQQ